MLLPVVRVIRASSSTDDIAIPRCEIPVPVRASQTWLRWFTAARESEQPHLGRLTGKTWEDHSPFAFAVLFHFAEFGRCLLPRLTLFKNRNTAASFGRNLVEEFELILPFHSFILGISVPSR